MRSISSKMIVAFVAVSVVGIILITLLARGASTRAFRSFVQEQVQVGLVEGLQEYYGRNDSWQGIEQARFQSQFFRGPSRGGGRVPNPGYLLADANGTVLVGGSGIRRGSPLPADQLELGIPVEVDGRLVGTVVVLDSLGAEIVPPDLLDAFYDQVERAVIIGGIGTLLISVLLSVFFTRSLTRPLRELTTATRQVAAGNLEEQVPVRSQDELGELATAFNQMNNDLRQAQIQRRQMTADIAHDLRTPLSVILGHAEGLRDGVLPADDETYFIIYDEAQRLQRLVNELRTLSLADAGELQLTRRAVEPMALLGRAASAHGPQAQQKDVTLLVEGGDTLSLVNVDADRIAQVLDNLVSNALRHTPAGGRIILSGQQVNGEVRLQVADTGSGIASDELPHLFNRFYRGDKARQRHAGGSGLGLAIAKSIVTNHGGRIWAKSEQGRGATFVIGLPAT